MTQIPLNTPSVIPTFNPKAPNEVFDPTADPVIPLPAGHAYAIR
jgi:hypothetical protein